jgi:hypothetical protein
MHTGGRNRSCAAANCQWNGQVEWTAAAAVTRRPPGCRPGGHGTNADASRWADSVKPETAEYSPTDLPTQFGVRFTWTIAVRLGKNGREAKTPKRLIQLLADLVQTLNLLEVWADVSYPGSSSRKCKRQIPLISNWLTSCAVGRRSSNLSVCH